MLQDIFDHLVALGLGAGPAAHNGYLFHEGDPVQHLHYVVAGSVELQRVQGNGSSITLQRAQAGSFLAEASLYADRYHCDAISSGPSELVRFSKSQVVRVLEAEPRLSTLWASHLAREVQHARGQIEILSRNRVADRLDGWLAWSDSEFPERGDWKQIAEQIAVSPEALYRELARRRKLRDQ